MGWYRTTIGPPFPGLELTRPSISQAPGMSADMLNLEGDGLRWAKRPGISKEFSTALAGPVYDLKFAHPTVGSFASFFAIALYRAASNVAARGTYRPTGSGGVTDGGAISGALTDASMIGTLHPAGGNAVLIGGPLSYTTNARYFLAGTTTNPAVGFYLGPDGGAGSPGTARYDVMGRHKLCMFVDRYNLASKSSRLQFTDPDAPLVWPPNNYVDAENLGRYPSLQGFKSAGDVAYAGGSHGIYAITGATPQTFKMHETDADCGFSGSRACDALKGILYGIATRLGQDTDVPFDLFAASGLSVQRFGEPVRSLVLNTNGGAYTDARVRAWPWRDAVLFMPRRAGGSAAARDVIYFHQPSKSFWKWTLPSEISPNCFECDAGQMWIGCQDGRIRYFDAAAANDDGTAFSSYGTSGPIIHPEGRLMRLRQLLVWGKQTGGSGNLTITVSQDGAAYAAPAGTHAADSGAVAGEVTLPTTETNVAKRLDYPDNTTLSYVTNIKAAFAAAGIGSEVTRIDALFETGEWVS